MAADIVMFEGVLTQHLNETRTSLDDRSTGPELRILRWTFDVLNAVNIRTLAAVAFETWIIYSAAVEPIQIL